MTLAPFTCFRIPQIGAMDEFVMELTIVSLDKNRAIYSRNGVEACMINGSVTANPVLTNWISRRLEGAGAKSGFQHKHRYISAMASLSVQFGDIGANQCEIPVSLPPGESLVGKTGEDFSMLTFGLSCKNITNAFIWGAGTLEFSSLVIRSGARTIDVRQDSRGEFWDIRSRYHFIKQDMRDHFDMNTEHQ